MIRPLRVLDPCVEVVIPDPQLLEYLFGSDGRAGVQSRCSALNRDST